MNHGKYTIKHRLGTVVSKASQLKRSMYELGKKDGKRYYPRYPKTKDYMRGYNKKEIKYFNKPKTKSKSLPRIIIFLSALTVTVYLGSTVL